MSKILRPFLIALTVVVSLHLASFIFLKSIGDFDLEDFKRVLSISIPVFFIPPFLSYLFFKKEEKNSLFKVPLLSFVILYAFIFISYKFIETKTEYSFFADRTIFNAVISFFIALFFNLIQLIKQKSLKKEITLSINVKHKVIYYILIPTCGVIVYSIMFVLTKPSTFSDILQTWKMLLPTGILLCLLSFEFFKYIYKRKNLRLLYIITFYIISISIFLLILALPNILNYIKIGHGIFYMIFIPVVILFFPYFLFVIVVSHASFLNLIHKQEKKILQQESLESQLNYQQLKNQLSPHFLFNNINVLTSLIEENPKKAVLFSEKLSNIYRYFLEQEKQDVVLLKDEIYFAKDYLHLLQDRFENGFNFLFEGNFDIDKYIVSTTLQQVLENVVKHNEISKENSVKIIISIDENYLRIINNKNKKVALENTSKKGIENIKKRYQYFTDLPVLVKNEKENFIINLPLLEK